MDHFFGALQFGQEPKRKRGGFAARWLGSNRSTAVRNDRQAQGFALLLHGCSTVGTHRIGSRVAHAWLQEQSKRRKT